MERDGEKAILYGVIREALSDKKTFEWSLECNEGAVHLAL